MRRALNFWVLGGDMRQAKLAELLAEDGVQVARRTVAKYRMELHLPSSSVRRR